MAGIGLVLALDGDSNSNPNPKTENHWNFGIIQLKPVAVKKSTFICLLLLLGVRVRAVRHEIASI